MALEPGRGRTATPVRSTMFGITLAVMAFAASFTFGSSFHHLLAKPYLFGADFDLGGGFVFDDEFPAEEAVAILQDDPAVGAISGGNFSRFVRVGKGPNPNLRVNVWGFDLVKGSAHPTLVEGRWPVASSEIALGSKTLGAIHADLGQTVTVQGNTQAIRMKVVGRAVFPDFAFAPGFGVGAGMTYEALKQLTPGAGENIFLIRLAPGVDREAARERLDEAFQQFGPNVGIQGVESGTNLEYLKRTEGLPLLLFGILALAALTTLAHTLVTSIRRRRRDLAILKTLGFVRRQISATVAWQATVVAAVSLVVGLPLGIAAGRWGWTFFADQLGVVPEPVIPFSVTLLAIPTLVLLANLIAVLPGRLASRIKPAAVLRSE
jgi:ABC-type antimicrobial peptide transport system permease subunit